MKPRTIINYGMPHPPNIGKGGTWIESEEACSDYGQFKRRAMAKHCKTNALVACRADVCDTAFSTPATTKTESGYITCNDSGELEFHPNLYQDKTPAEFRKSVKKAYK